jgi:hypothetical protein
VTCCKAQVKGSGKELRGRIVGTVNGSSTALTADLE